MKTAPVFNEENTNIFRNETCVLLCSMLMMSDSISHSQKKAATFICHYETINKSTPHLFILIEHF